MNSLRIRAPLVPKAFDIGITRTIKPNHSCAPVGVKVAERATANNRHISNNFVVSSSGKKEVYLKTIHKGKVFTSSAGFRIGTPMITQRRNYSSYIPPIYQSSAKLIKSHYGGTTPIDYLKTQPETDADVEAFDRRQFSYLMNSTMRFGITAAAQSVVIKFLSNWSANKKVLAVAQIEVDISKIDIGRTITITWRGKPVFIKHRTEEEINAINAVPMEELRDPQTDDQRTNDKNWSILLAICTHLGCVPVTDAGAFNAFFCPCHGSHYDAAGRIRRGPAPLNLEVPKHEFVQGGQMVILG